MCKIKNLTVFFFFFVKLGRRFNGNYNSKNHFNRHCCNESIGLTTDIDSTTFVDTDDESFYQCPNDEDGIYYFFVLLIRINRIF